MRRSLALGNICEHFIHGVEENIGICSREDERRPNFQNVRARTTGADQHTLLAQTVDEASGLIRRGLLRCMIRDKFNTGEETRTADIADQLMTLRQRAQAVTHM